MAGATVYQLEPHPIASEDIMVEAHAIDTRFYDSIADYVHEVDDRDSIENYLANSLLRMNKDREVVDILRNAHGRIQTITFKEGFKEAYFAGAYVNFMKHLAELTAFTTLPLFVEGKLEMRLFELNSAYNEEFRDYVCTNEYEFITFDEFVRNAEVDTTYYLGGIMNYHF